MVESAAVIATAQPADGQRRRAPGSAAARAVALVALAAVAASGCRNDEDCYPLETTYCAAVAEALCHVEMLCLDDVGDPTLDASKAACVAAETASCEAASKPLLVALSTVEALAYQGKPAARCLNGLMALTCEDLSRLDRELELLEPSCHGMTIGRAAIAEPCAYDATCEGDCYCSRADGTPLGRGFTGEVDADGAPVVDLAGADGAGTCQPSATFTEACACGGPHCAGGFRCVAAGPTSADGFCLRQSVTIGGDCVDDLQCVGGTACFDGVCDEAPGENAACTEAQQCLDGRFCGDASGLPELGTDLACLERLAAEQPATGTTDLGIGDPCDGVTGLDNPCAHGASCVCPSGTSCASVDRICVVDWARQGEPCQTLGAFCDRLGRIVCRAAEGGPVCQALPVLGEPCGPSDGATRCFGARCDPDGQCVARATFGTPCTEDDQCAFGRCLDAVCRPASSCDGMPFWVPVRRP